MSAKLKYFVIYKPDGMLTQFSPEGDKLTLKDMGFDFPTDVYPVGRLDELSEGLLILTNDKALNSKLLDPKFKHSRSYWACVSGQITDEAINQLEKGVSIKLKNSRYQTKPAKAERIEAPELAPRQVSFSYSQKLGLSWINLSLTEGKNRQVRKMTAQVGFPTLRLIRNSIENLQLGKMQPFDVVEYERPEIYKLLKIKG